jgi:hypothetical protein
MEDRTRYTPIAEGEMDLTEILKKLIAYFRKNRAIFLVSCVMGLVIAALIYKLSPRVYTSRLVLESTVLNVHEQAEIVSNWDEQLNTRGYPILARIFNCDPGLISQVSELKVETVGLPMEGNAAFALIIETQDTLGLPAMQDALVYAFKSNDYSRQRVAIRTQNLKDEIAKAEQQLNALDSAHQIVDDFRNGVKSGSSQLMLDVSTIPEQRLNIQEKLAGYKERLAFVNDIQVLQPFLRPKKARPVLILFAVVGLLGGFFIGYLFSLMAMVRSINKK